MSGTYLVFGGVGFVGRNLVTYLVNSPAVAHIVVVDKVRICVRLDDLHNIFLVNPFTFVRFLVNKISACNVLND